MTHVITPDEWFRMDPNIHMLSIAKSLGSIYIKSCSNNADMLAAGITGAHRPVHLIIGRHVSCILGTCSVVV